MNCPKHPHQKMIALFTSWVCDICDPPQDAAEAALFVAGLGTCWLPSDEEIEEWLDNQFTD